MRHILYHLYSKNIFVEFDDCASGPCQHGGSCTDQVSGYTCNCVDGYNGTNCETGKNAALFQIRYRYQNIYLVILTQK